MDFEDVSVMSLLLFVVSVILILYMLLRPPGRIRREAFDATSSPADDDNASLSTNVQLMRKSFQEIAEKIKDMTVSLSAIAKNTTPN